MSKPDSIMIDDVKYVRADKVQVPSGPIKIFVLDRGFVYVGRMVTPAYDGDQYHIENAYNIRYWGTKNGLGELVNGPLKDTKLDKVGTVHIPERAIIHIIDVVESAWAPSGI